MPATTFTPTQGSNAANKTYWLDRSEQNATSLHMKFGEFAFKAPLETTHDTDIRSVMKVNAEGKGNPDELLASLDASKETKATADHVRTLMADAVQQQTSRISQMDPRLVLQALVLWTQEAQEGSGSSS